MGPPGSGKGTYAARLQKKLRIPHISTGDIFREEIRSETELGRQVKDFLERGDLVPDAVVNGVVETRLGRGDCQAGFLLDGYPRTVGQVEALEGLLAKSQAKIRGVLLVEIARETLVRRISGRRVCPECGSVFNIFTMKPVKEGVCDKCSASLVQRPDDKEETANHRLDLHDKQSAPIIKYYEKDGVLIRINGSAALDHALESMLQAVEALP